MINRPGYGGGVSGDGWQRTVSRVLRVDTVTAEVVDVVDLTPWYRRIRLSSPALLADLSEVPTQWVRLWVPDPVRGEPVQRGYTVVEPRPEDGTFALDFVLHDAPGPASDWARTAAPGVRVEVARTPRDTHLPDGATEVLLAGDVTALPAIASWCVALPATIAVTAYVEDGHPDHDAIPVPAQVRWLTPSGASGAALAEAARQVTPSPHLFAWAAGERALVKAIRPVFRDHLRLAHDHRYSQAYWIAGRPSGV